MVDIIKSRGRPKHCRRVAHTTATSRFAPDRCHSKEPVQLEIDELEAIRLTDLESMYQADAAQLMNISRQTLGRILKQAHLKVADAIINGKVLNIHGGHVKYRQSVEIDLKPQPGRVCPRCKNKETHNLEPSDQSGKCPSCGYKT